MQVNKSSLFLEPIPNAQNIALLIAPLSHFPWCAKLPCASYCCPCCKPRREYNLGLHIFHSSCDSLQSCSPSPRNVEISNNQLQRKMIKHGYTLMLFRSLESPSVVIRYFFFTNADFAFIYFTFLWLRSTLNAQPRLPLVHIMFPPRSTLC